MKKRNDFRFYSLVIVGLVISLFGLLTPPLGHIDNSILLLVGNLTILVGGVLEVVIYLNIKKGIFFVGKHTIEEIKKDLQEELKPTENKEIQ
jgi:hypothetical protein